MSSYGLLSNRSPLGLHGLRYTANRTPCKRYLTACMTIRAIMPYFGVITITWAFKHPYTIVWG
nr:MAG TPA: hypothetical protein [Podoviridae sp. ctbMi3]